MRRKYNGRRIFLQPPQGQWRKDLSSLLHPLQGLQEDPHVPLVGLVEPVRASLLPLCKVFRQAGGVLDVAQGGNNAERRRAKDPAYPCVWPRPRRCRCIWGGSLERRVVQTLRCLQLISRTEVRDACGDGAAKQQPVRSANHLGD